MIEKKAEYIIKQHHMRNGGVKAAFVKGKNYIISKTIMMSMIKDFTFAAVKTAIGIYTLSIFLCISGLNSFLSGCARRTYLESEKKARGDSAKEYRSYLKMALLILGGSVAFTFYMARLFIIPSYENFGTIPGIAIAAMAFAELGFAISGVAKTKDLLSSGIKMLNLTSALSALVLTQVALLSFAQENDLSYFNALAGVLFGGLSIIAALYMIVRYALHKHSKIRE